MHTPSQPSISTIQLYHQYIHPQQNNKQHKTTSKPSLRAIKPRQRPSRSSTNKQRTHPANRPSQQYNYITNISIHNKTINNTKQPASLAYGQLSHARGPAGRLLTNNAHTQPTVHLNNTTISPIYPSTTKQ